ncbi:MAG: hypothetical protein LKF79_08965 [Solobacterium sp.]|jgi:hypothetical protein|nr:hypothetical protein [Solobacterium sp.]MCH4266758.1 hypothetical protein [Solobacterium sp.]
MTQKEKFYLSIGILLLAYAYAVTGYEMPSLCFGILAAVLSVSIHSLRRLKDHMMTITVSCMIQAIVIRVTGMDHLIPVLPALSLCNAVFSSCSLDSSRKTVLPAMRILGKVMIGFMTAALILPENWLLFLTPAYPSSRMMECLLVLVIFLPILAVYLMHALVPHPVHVQKRRSLENGLRTR